MPNSVESGEGIGIKVQGSLANKYNTDYVFLMYDHSGNNSDDKYAAFESSHNITEMND